MSILVGNLIRHLSYMADADYQKRVWVERNTRPGDMCISYTESACMVFDDTGLADVMEKGQPIFSFVIDKVLYELLELVKRTEETYPEEVFIESLAMQAVREKATRALHELIQGIPYFNVMPMSEHGKWDSGKYRL